MNIYCLYLHLQQWRYLLWLISHRLGNGQMAAFQSGQVLKTRQSLRPLRLKAAGLQLELRYAWELLVDIWCRYSLVKFGPITRPGTSRTACAGPATLRSARPCRRRYVYGI